jgi:hypothetical protein
MLQVSIRDDSRISGAGQTELLHIVRMPNGTVIQESRYWLKKLPNAKNGVLYVKSQKKGHRMIK